ncbi:hypothetical protein HYR99_26855 [Candidatus Poribacteria bacterium]|nr:hypothetical protein [Candidatus Poribacteria bacterium]
MNEQWKGLFVSDFESICRKVFDSYMRRCGFTDTEADESGAITYFKQNRFLRVHYYPEESPTYSPMIDVGFVAKDEDASISRFEGIGLWYAIPEGTPVRNYGFWTFASPKELEKVLLQIRDEVVDVYARPLWEEPSRLRYFIEQQKKEIQKHYGEERMNRKKREADLAFRSGNYQEALKIYDEIDISELSRLELKRIELSSRFHKKP